jgi:hypothetical protein
MKDLEQLIHEEMAGAAERVMRLSRSAAVAAFEQSFACLVGHRQVQAAAPHSTKKPRRSPSRSPVPPRSRTEIDELSRRLLEAVRAEPGQTMAALAPRLQVDTSQLQVPAARLKKASRVKTVGQRQFTCYFPADDQDVA